MGFFMCKWAMPAWRALFARDGPGEGCLTCRACKNTASDDNPVIYRCTQCLHGLHLCAKCCVKAHMHNPLHVVEEWDDRRRFWLKVSLMRLGLVINLGHDGEKCACVTLKPRTITVIHENGVHEVALRFCDCQEKQGEATPEPIQLLEAGFWPGSWKRPRTVITLGLLHQFQILSAQARTNAYDFYNYLARLTDNISPDDVADKYRVFLTATREFYYIKLCKYFDLEPSEKINPASLALLCPACPHLKINMDVDPKSRALNLLYLDAIDPDDVALTEGKAYFAPTEDVKTFLKLAKPTKREKSTCHKFGALGYFGHWGAVSGTIGILCARHMFALPGGAVDLQKGERYANVDVAMLCGLQLWMDLLLHYSVYDINCQYRIHFEDRMEDFRALTAEFSGIRAKYFPNTIPGVGKFHLPAHITYCRYKFSFHYLPGAAMIDGESNERMWAGLNEFANRTREMSAGHRQDVINFFFADQNFKRQNAMAKTLRRKWDAAVEHSQKVKTYVANLEKEIERSSIGAAQLRRWKRRELDWLDKVVDMKKHEDLENPYEPEQEDPGTRAQRMQKLAVEVSNAGLSEGLIGVVEEGIELQESNDIEQFTTQAAAWREKAEAFLSPLVDAAASHLTEEEQQVCAATLVKSAETGQVDEEAENWEPQPPREDGDDDPDPDDPDASKRPKKRTRTSKDTSIEVDEEKAPQPKRRRRRKKSQIASALETMPSVTPTMLSTLVFSARSVRPQQASPSKKRKRNEAESDSRPGGPRQRTAEWLALNSVFIELPSSHDPLLRNQEAMQIAVVIEKTLRQHYGLHLDSMRLHGQKFMVRARGSLKRKWTAIRADAGAYRRIRRVLLALGMSTKDKIFKPLEKDDVKAFTVLTEDQLLGDSKQPPSWIWENMSFIKAQDDESVRNYCIEAYRVLCGDQARAAYARKQAYRYQRLLEGCKRTFKGAGVDVDSLKAPAFEPKEGKSGRESDSPVEKSKDGAPGASTDLVSQPHLCEREIGVERLMQQNWNNSWDQDSAAGEAAEERSVEEETSWGASEEQSTVGDLIDRLGWGAEQTEPGEWDATMLSSGWGVLDAISARKDEEWLEQITDPEVREAMSRRGRVRLVICTKEYELSPAPVITRLNGDFLVLKDLERVRRWFDLDDDVVLDVWDVRRCEWRSVRASQPIYVSGQRSVLARVHGIHSVPKMWREVRLCAEGNDDALGDPKAVNMVDSAV
ncbi:hypothetical protein NM688_g4199 [Phlebia brevispora]|uniref:Uncharacterized protein n=1 Tax=Phlebia brevispora TaxID=194682 RepID=A0ACC1T403_9APHY|nr:hypothetical protein NM688_g4199 [Phlebia brevispora]